MVYSIAIVDDEKDQMEIMENYIAQYFRENGGEYTISKFFDGIELVKGYAPVYDIVFLDIEMEKLNGYSAAKKIRQTDENTAIIFVTRLARFALKGYEVSALDFMVKPLAYSTFASKMKRIQAYADKNRKKVISVNAENGTVYLEEKDIYYVEVVSHYIIYHTAKGIFKEWGALKNVMERLSDEKFKMCNRCYIVNLRYVKAIKDNAVVVGTDELIISRYKKKEFIEAVASFLGGMQ